MQLTDFAENLLVDWFWRGQAAPALPATWYVALLTTAPGEAGGGVEVVGGSYARVPLPRTLAAMSGTQGAGTVAASNVNAGTLNLTTTNNADINFAQPTGNWGLVTHIGLCDAAAGGNIWMYAPMPNPQDIRAGNAAPRLPAGALRGSWS